MSRVVLVAALLVLSLVACSDPGTPAESGRSAAPAAEVDAAGASHARMVERLDRIDREARRNNFYLGDRLVRETRAELEGLKHLPIASRLSAQIPLAEYLLRLGEEREAIALLEEAHRALRDDPRIPAETRQDVAFRLGLAWMRLGETKNCCARNNADSCILPIQGEGVHTDPEGSREASRVFLELLQEAPPGSPHALKARWLLNVAAMTLGEWPDAVPVGLRLTREQIASDEPFPRFVNVARDLGLAGFDNCGGAIVDDFDGDHLLDVLVSSWDTSRSLRLHRNMGDGTFADVTREAGLAEIRGGLNIVHADCDEDGDLDVVVLRGGWWSVEGRHPNSLLLNDGKGHFVDVGLDAGLAGNDYPTQAAAFADYDGDGDLDLYVGNEQSPELRAPSQLFRNRGDGTFEDVAARAGVTNDRWAKGVTWGDYDDDGFPDLYVSNLGAPNRLYHNEGDGTFRDVAEELGVAEPLVSFPTWFFDYDNDGSLDLFVAAYDAPIDVVAAGYFGLPVSKGLPRLYHGDGHGGFEEVGRASGLTQPLPVMGCNFGDLDQDGYLDMYLGTGDTNYETLLPNVMYRNRAGAGFADVTVAGGFGNLQKGHGIAFCDLDNDGDQDVFQQMGGAFPGDRFYNACFENPGFAGRGWVTLRLHGEEANRSAIGARLRLTLEGPSGERVLHRTVGTGASFGGNPLRQEIGLGDAERILRLEVTWPGSRTHQVFEDLEPRAFYELTEGGEPVRLELEPFRLAAQAH